MLLPVKPTRQFPIGGGEVRQVTRTVRGEDDTDRPGPVVFDAMMGRIN